MLGCKPGTSVIFQAAGAGGGGRGGGQGVQLGALGRQERTGVGGRGGGRRGMIGGWGGQGVVTLSRVGVRGTKSFPWEGSCCRWGALERQGPGFLQLLGQLSTEQTKGYGLDVRRGDPEGVPLTQLHARAHLNYPGIWCVPQSSWATARGAPGRPAAGARTQCSFPAQASGRRQRWERDRSSRPYGDVVVGKKYL